MLKKLEKKRIFFIVMTFLTAIEIFLFSTISMPTGGREELSLATIYHLGIFFMFTFFLSLSIINKKINIKLLSTILLISLAYAISDEFHQLFVPGRFASEKDIIIDFLGSIISVSTLKVFEKFNKL